MANNFFHNLTKPFKFSSSKEEQNQEDLEKIAAQEQKQFQFETLVSATKNFHPTHKLGEGGFGPVYKGKLGDGREIAVKKFSRSSNQGKTGFMKEAKSLARVQHRNVVNLLGYCAHGEEKLLVYEYVANESLDKLLFESNREQLVWKRRFDIITGIARGLLYLHQGSHSCIIHRNMKASNVLLDGKWVPKLADFGMARLFPEDETRVNTRAAGTNGYMAPEYVMHGHLSVKADVFSFGVLVLELISGQRNSTFSQQAEAQNLLDWAYKLHKKERSMEIMDPPLAASAPPDEVKMCIHLALLCTQGDPQLRPHMGRVVLLLSKKTSHLEEPTRPGIPGSRYRRSRRRATGGTSGSAGTFSEFNRSTSDLSSNISRVTSTASTSAPTSPKKVSDPHGKRPMQS